jgi:hypothetical protein
MSQLGPLTPEERKGLIQGSGLLKKYKDVIDNVSAYEILKGRSSERLPVPSPQAPQPQAPQAPGPARNEPVVHPPSNPIGDILFGKTGPRGGRQTQGVLEAAAKSAARSIGSELGRQILRGVLGSILGKKR